MSLSVARLPSAGGSATEPGLTLGGSHNLEVELADGGRGVAVLYSAWSIVLRQCPLLRYPDSSDPRRRRHLLDVLPAGRDGPPNQPLQLTSHARPRKITSSRPPLPAGGSQLSGETLGGSHNLEVELADGGRGVAVLFQVGRLCFANAHCCGILVRVIRGVAVTVGCAARWSRRAP